MSPVVRADTEVERTGRWCPTTLNVPPLLAPLAPPRLPRRWLLIPGRIASLAPYGPDGRHSAALGRTARSADGAPQPDPHGLPGKVPLPLLSAFMVPVGFHVVHGEPRGGGGVPQISHR
jgi:hypothetical protein